MRNARVVNGAFRALPRKLARGCVGRRLPPRPAACLPPPHHSDAPGGGPSEDNPGSSGSTGGNGVGRKSTLGASLLAAALAISGAAVRPPPARALTAGESAPVSASAPAPSGAGAVERGFSMSASPGGPPPTMTATAPAPGGSVGGGAVRGSSGGKAVFREDMFVDYRNPWWPKARSEQKRLPEMFYDDLWRDLKRDKVEKVVFMNDSTTAVVKHKGTEQLKRVGVPCDPDLLNALLSKRVVVDQEPPSRNRDLAIGYVNTTVPILAIITLAYAAFGVKKQSDLLDISVFKKNKKGGNGHLVRSASLKDVAGLDAVRQEVEELIEYLTNPGRFQSLGARVPKGVLLVGPPGCGKTLLARAMASEAGVPFFALAGSDFSEMFVGVGAARVRNLFQQARACAPCIIFVDEIDAVAKARGTDTSNDAGEAENTINQLLTEMDGFDKRDGVIVMGATNRPGVLDPALTRPGRFDRTVTLPLPDKEGRVEVMKVHAAGVKIADNVDWDLLAYRTAGMNGADLAHLINAASLEAIRRGDAEITNANLNTIVDRQLAQGGAGNSNESRETRVQLVSERERRILATGVCGKALLASLCAKYDEVSRVSIIPDRSTDWTNINMIKDEARVTSGIVTLDFLEKQLMVNYGGRAAEALLLGEGEATAAWTEDVEQNCQTALKLVLCYGFSPKLGPISYAEVPDDDMRFISSDKAELRFRELSDGLKEEAWKEASLYLSRAEERARTMLEKNRHVLEAMVEKLASELDLEGKTIHAMCEELGATPYDVFDDKLVDVRFNPDTGARVWPPHIDTRSRFPDAMALAQKYAEQFSHKGVLEPDMRDFVRLATSGEIDMEGDFLKFGNYLYPRESVTPAFLEDMEKLHGTPTTLTKEDFDYDTKTGLISLKK